MRIYRYFHRPIFWLLYILCFSCILLVPTIPALLLSLFLDFDIYNLGLESVVYFVLTFFAGFKLAAYLSDHVELLEARIHQRHQSLDLPNMWRQFFGD